MLLLLIARAFAISATIAYLSSASPIAAQNVQRNNEAVDLGLRGNLTVNPATRGLELQIPLGSYPGRAGHDLPVTISYSSKLWNLAYQGFAPGPPPGYGYGPAPFTILMAKYGEHSVSGWNSTTGGPYIDPRPGDQLYDQFGNARGTGNCSAGCFIIDRVMAWMPDGSGHELRSSDQALIFTQQRPDNLYAVDGSRLRYQRSTNTLFLPDGSRYVMSNPGGYIDRNGNTINATDTLGRTIGNPPFSSIPGDYGFSLPGVGVGGTVNYTFKWRYLADVLTTSQPLAYVANNGCPPGTGSFFSPNLFSSDIDGRTCIQNAMQLFNPVVLSQIVLPTGQSYTFTYNTYGEIDRVTLPTGGYERYIYTGVLPISNGTYVYTQYNRGVASRIVSPTGLSADEVSWVYSGGGPYVNMVAPDGTRTERYAWGDGNSMWGYSADGARSGRAYDERVYSASNQMLRRTLTEWAMTGSNGTANPGGLQYANRNARVTRETEFILDTGGGALAKTTTFDYDLTYQFDVGIDQTSVSQYDYVLVDQNTAQTLPIASLSSIPNGTLLRTIQTAYLTGNANYRSRNIVGLPTSTTIYKGAATDNIVVAQSSTSYDEGGPFAQLNDYGSVLNWTDPQTAYRGNPTTASRWLNFVGATLSTFPNGAYLTTHAQYDQCGSMRKSWDARDTALINPSQVSYADAFSDGVPRNTYALPTSMITAVPDPSGAYGSNVAFTTTNVYDFNTSRVMSTTDANSKTTTFDYTDPLNRLKQVTAPNGARVRHNYSDTPDDLYVQTLTDEDTRSIETRQYFDKLGRPVRSFLYDGYPSTPWSVTDTYYDSMARVAKISIPYRVGSPSSGVPASCSACTTNVFDPMGRVLSATTPDSAQVTSSYAALTSGGLLGTTVTVTDQTGKQRRSLTDALGRLVRVDEPDASGNLGDVSSPVQPTSYAYDILGNLRTVTQGSQQRFFTYDSLSRLIRARNPEQSVNANLSLTDSLSGNSQWCMSYAYDNNGNLTTKIDARNVTATYDYDGLNRNKTTTYTNDPASTPAVSRFYDGWRAGAYNSSISNSKGRLWQSETAGATGTRITTDSFDVMGRPTMQEQQFYYNSAWSQAYVTQRGYDLAGHVTSQIYPSGHTVSYNFDQAGRLGDKDSNNLAFSGNLGDGLMRTYASISGANAYDAASRMREEKFGTTIPLFHKQHFNIRGQLYDVRLSSQSLQTNEWDWDRGAVVSYYSSNNIFGGSGTDNNGNVITSETYIPGSSWFQDRYAYDSLNRLISVNEFQNGSSQTISQYNYYDRYGNRTLNTAASFGYPAIPTIADQNTNRLYAQNDPSHTLMDYDAAGNQTKDYLSWNGTRTYDAENRMIGANNGTTATYTYDGHGRRVKRKIGTLETWQVYGASSELLAEYAPNAPATTPDKEYGYRNEQLLVTAAVVDLALGKTATQSSTFSNAGVTFSASLAVDGNTDGAFWDVSSATTNYGPQNWWQVDLGSSQSIGSIKVWPRTDCCPEMTANFYVLVSDNPFTSNDLTTTLNQSGVSNYWVADGNASVATVNVNRTGRYVRIQRNDSQYLVLAEVKVLRGGQGQTSTQNVSWTNAVGVSVSGNSLTKTAGSGWGNGGAASTQSLSAGDGYVECTSSETSTYRMIGLSHGDSNQSWDDIDFAIYPNSGGALQVYEAGTLRGSFGTYTTGDVLRVAVEGGVVKYRKNGVLLYTSNVAPIYPLLVDTSFYDYGGTISNAVISGNLGTGGADMEWLIADQLGTPRMIADATGSLSGIKRHDYLPFGEELFAGQGGRTGPQGYSIADGIRQKFTSKERDNETGLDYFGARYYSSTQGRFTSPDEFTGGPTELFAEVAAHNPAFYAELAEPQSLNKYHYALNNPLRYVDPDGHQTTIADRIRNAAASVRDTAATVARAAAPVINGASSAFYEDNGLPGNSGPQNTGGRAVGHVVALAQSAAEIFVGGVAAVGGGAEAIVTSPAVVTVVGAAAPAVGAAVAVGGVVTAAHGVLVGANTLHNIYSKSKHPKKERTAQGAADQAEDIEKNQAAQRKAGQGDAIQNTDKSKQDMKKELKKIKKLDDAN